MDVRRSPSREGLYFSANFYMGCYDEKSTIIAESPPTHSGNASDSGQTLSVGEGKDGNDACTKGFSHLKLERIADQLDALSFARSR